MRQRVKDWWNWFVANFLTIDLTTYRPPTEKPRNRKERRMAARKEENLMSFWKYVPWYKYTEYIGAWRKHKKNYGFESNY